MQHGIYSLLRKKDLFNLLNSMLFKSIYEDESIYNNLKAMIVFQNINNLSLFFNTLNNTEKKYILQNSDKIKKLFQLHQWEKGARLFELVIQKYNYYTTLKR